MKQLFAILFFTTLWLGMALGQPSPTYVNNGQIITNIPPQIDAYSFVNNGLFEISSGSVTVFSQSLSLASTINVTQPYDFSDVTNYLNRGTMTSDSGFTFDTASATNGFRHSATSFYNANPGYISSGTLTNSIYTELLVYYAGEISSYPQVNVYANTITNTGTLSGGVTSTIRVFGNSLNLSRGTIHIEGVSDYIANDYFGNLLASLNVTVAEFSPNTVGIVENYYAIGNETNDLATFTLPDVSSPSLLATNFNGSVVVTDVNIPNAAPYVYVKNIDASNVTYQVVFVNTNLAGISTSVRFQNESPFNVPVIQWQSIITNINGLIIGTNSFYLTDQLGFSQTNYLVTNGFTYTQVPEPAPFNFSFSRSYNNFTNLLGPTASVYDSTIFREAFPATNVFAFEEISLSANSYQPDVTAVTSSITNVPGRIYIAATNYLDLTRAKVTGANYLNLMATNHFAGSAFAQIVAPALDINVGTTNGMLSISNLVAPFISQFSGLIDMYSALWTNVDASGITNKYNVLIVNSSLTTTSTVSVLNFAARSTNIIINDFLNIAGSVVLNAQNITVATNDSAAQIPYGILDMFGTSALWSSSFPTLQNFTNYGVVATSNTTYFLTTTNDPTYNQNYSPYQSFVNDGWIMTAGNVVFANYLENVGPGTNKNLSSIATNTFVAGYLGSAFGPIILQASNAVLAGGDLIASNGDVTISAGNLLLSNNLVLLSGALTFSITNKLVDGGATSSNVIGAGDGINLLVKPTVGDFLGTTVYISSPAELEVDDIWAGLDLSNSVAGFANNGALGHLILTGGDANSQFFFGGPDTVTNYALYVDLLELQSGATNRVSQANGNVNFSAFDFAPNFKIYFADALIGTNDISEKLNGANNGQFVWVSAYAGIFSSVDITYPSGITYQFNRALRNSPDISSNGHTPNESTIYPFTVNLAINRTNKPTAGSVLNWYAPADSTNTVYYQTNLVSTNWLVFTNFVQGSGAGRISLTDSIHTNTRSFYKVQINPAQ